MEAAIPMEAASTNGGGYTNGGGQYQWMKFLHLAADRQLIDYRSVES